MTSSGGGSRERIETALSGAMRRLRAARETLDTMRSVDGEVEDLRSKRRAATRELETLGERLEELRALLSAEAEHEAPTELFSLEDQHAVSRLMQDTAVHLAVRRERDFWEIRHRHTADGRPSEPLRARTLAEVYALYERDAVRRGGFEPPAPRELTAEEQAALATFRDLAIDHPRSIRWERTKTEVDYVDRDGEPAGGNRDAVEFPPGELIGPVEFLETKLG